MEAEMREKEGSSPLEVQAAKGSEAAEALQEDRRAGPKAVQALPEEEGKIHLMELAEAVAAGKVAANSTAATNSMTGGVTG